MLDPNYQIQSFAESTVGTVQGVYQFGEGIYEGDGAKSAEALPSVITAAASLAPFVRPLSSLRVFTNTGKTFKSSSIRFSQDGVNKYGKAVQSVKSGNYDPIDIVKLDDGMYTTIDNTRLLAAQNENLSIKANIHNYNDALPDGMLNRFKSPNKRGEFAKTWGEAVEFRTNSQGSDFKKNYGGTGSFVQPKIKSQ